MEQRVAGQKGPNTRLRAARKAYHWTQEQLGEKLGDVPAQTVRSWELGKRFPSLEMRGRLCAVFGMTEEDLGFQREDEQDLTRVAVLSPPLAGQALPKTAFEHLPLVVLEQKLLEAFHVFPLVRQSGWFDYREDLKNRRRMLDRVQSRWISGFLDHIHPLISLSLQLRPEAVANPWRARNQEPYGPALQVPTRSVSDVYDEADGELLLLGDPGSGKTILLLMLTRELVERCRFDESHPVPVIFHLSSWASRRLKLSDWLIEELNLKYQVPVNQARKWVANDQILPLLDGLDEVDRAARAACVEAINHYRQEHGFLPLVVCCRTTDYEALPDRLILGMAAEIQPLTREQIDEYVSLAGKDQAAVQGALQADPGVREAISTPLMLSMLLWGEQDIDQEDVLAHPSFGLVFERYVQRLLRKNVAHPYAANQITSWLGFLAWQMGSHNLTDFYVERMQPTFLEDSQRRHRYQRTVIRLVMSLQCVVSGSLVAWLKGGLKNGVVGSGNGILGLFGGGIGNSMLGWMAPGIGGGAQGGASLIIVFGLVYWLLALLIGGSALPTITLRAIWHGLLSGASAGLKIGAVGVALGIPLFAWRGGLHYGLIYGLGIGCFMAMMFGLMRGMMVGLRYEQPGRAGPVGTFADHVRDGLVWGVCGTLGFVAVEEWLSVNQQSTLIYGSIIFLFFGLAYGFGGGDAVFTSLAEQAIQPVEAVSWSWKNLFDQIGRNALRSLMVALVITISVSAVIGGISSLFFRVSYGVHYGLVFGTISGLIAGISGILTTMVKSGWSGTTLSAAQHIKPNEGIARSAQNALLSTCLFAPLGGLASGFACAVGFGLIGQLSTWPVMAGAFSFMLTIILFVIFFPAHGGIACVEHYVLRWYLWRARVMPANYVRFLDSAAEYALLRKVGGGYLFTHRLVLEHFARQYQSGVS